MMDKYNKYKIRAPDSGRPTESNRQPAGRSLEPRLYIFYISIISYIIFHFFLHHHFELSAQRDVNNNRFGTLLPDVL